MLFCGKPCDSASCLHRKSRIERLSTDEVQLFTTKSDGMWENVIEQGLQALEGFDQHVLEDDEFILAEERLLDLLQLAVGGHEAGVGGEVALLVLGADEDVF